MPPKVTAETALKRAIKNLAPHIKLHIWSIGASFGSHAHGLPDMFGIHLKRPVAIECKAPKGKMSPHQIKFRDAWTAAGGIYIEAKTPEDVTAALGIKGVLF